MIAHNRFLSKILILLILPVALTFTLSLTDTASAESWEKINTDGFGDIKNYDAFSMLVYYDELYVGTKNQGGTTQVWKYNGKTWKRVNIEPFSTYGTYLCSYAVFNDKVYIGSYNAPTGCKVLCYDGLSVYQVNEDGFGNPNNTGATSMCAYNGYLYVGTSQPDSGHGCEIWRTKGEGEPPYSDWERVGKPGMGTSKNTTAASMAVYGKLYIGTKNKTDGAQVWNYDGSIWRKVNKDGFGDSKTIGASSMCVLGQYLYVGTERTLGGLRVWRFDGSSWTKVCADGFADNNNVKASSMTVYRNKLYVGTMNEKNGCEVWRTGGAPSPPPPTPEIPTSFYFAEGFTGRGFYEYLCIGNANQKEATVLVTYMFNNGTGNDVFYTIPAMSRVTIEVNSVVGSNREVSMKILSMEKNIVAERIMYFNYADVWTGGHACIGAVSPAFKWYFAEGTTITGFDEYITVQNPTTAEAHLRFRYMIEGTGEVVYSESVQPESRATFSVKRHLGEGKHVSLLLESDQYIVAERPMYFNYGPGRQNWNDGHCIVGITSPQKTWYFAEGTTREGFESWLCIQNPEPVDIKVTAEYTFARGQGSPMVKTYNVPALQRLTLFLNKEVGAEKDVSVKLTSDIGFIAERPMYFLYKGAWDGGHDGRGVEIPATSWFFAEGYTGTNFDEWLSILNPNKSAGKITITYYTSKGQTIIKEHDIEPESRLTVYVNGDAGRDLELSSQISSTVPVVCERPMYFYHSGMTGGHVVTGFVPAR